MDFRSEDILVIVNLLFYIHIIFVSVIVSEFFFLLRT